MELLGGDVCVVVVVVEGHGRIFDGLNGDDVVRGEGGMARREEVFGLS